MGMRGVFFLIVLASLFLIPTISAVNSFYVPQNSNYSINFGCEIDEAICSNTAECNVSIYFPNSTALIQQSAATNLNGGEFEINLTFNQTATVGEYKINFACYDSDTNGTQTTYYEVNPSGIRSSEQRTDTISRSIYFMAGIALILFISFLFVKTSIPVKWTFFAFSILFFLISINLIFTSLQDETINPKLETFFGSFTAISWYFYWFIAGLLLIMWILTFMNTWILKKNLANAKRYGLA